MDSERAHELLARERTRLQRELQRLEREGPLAGSEHREPGDRDSEDLYVDERDVGRREELEAALAAVGRAEARLAAGTFGLSVESGQPIPDERLEVQPAAERTVQEDERRR